MSIKDSLESISKEHEQFGDDKEHLIGSQFVVSNSLESMILQKAENNRVLFRNFKNYLVKDVEKRNSVYVKIDPVYEKISGINTKGWKKLIYNADIKASHDVG